MSLKDFAAPNVGSRIRLAKARRCAPSAGRHLCYGDARACHNRPRVYAVWRLRPRDRGRSRAIRLQPCFALTYDNRANLVQCRRTKEVTNNSAWNTATRCSLQPSLESAHGKRRKLGVVSHQLFSRSLYWGCLPIQALTNGHCGTTFSRSAHTWSSASCKSFEPMPLPASSGGTSVSTKAMTSSSSF